MPKSRKQIAKQVKLRTFQALEPFISSDTIWEAFAATFWMCPLCGGKVTKEGCPTKNCWNHLWEEGDEQGHVGGDYPILGIECPRCGFEESKGPLCHTCKKALAKRE